MFVKFQDGTFPNSNSGQQIDWQQYEIRRRGHGHVGRSFEEAIQKGMRMIGRGAHGFVANKEMHVDDITKELKEPTDSRIFVISKAFEAGYTVDQIHKATKIDKWFLDRLDNICSISKEVEKANKLEDINKELMLKAKSAGFSDFQIAGLTRTRQTQIHIQPL